LVNTHGGAAHWCSSVLRDNKLAVHVRFAFSCRLAPSGLLSPSWRSHKRLAQAGTVGGHQPHAALASGVCEHCSWLRCMYSTFRATDVLGHILGLQTCLVTFWGYRRAWSHSGLQSCLASRV